MKIVDEVPEDIERIAARSFIAAVRDKKKGRNFIAAQFDCSSEIVSEVQALLERLEAQLRKIITELTAVIRENCVWFWIEIEGRHRDQFVRQKAINIRREFADLGIRLTYGSAHLT